MRWLERKTTVGTPSACTCDIFDMGPRCDFCVDACGDKGHPLGTHPSGHPDYCFCGDIDRRYGTRKPTVPSGSPTPDAAA